MHLTAHKGESLAKFEKEFLHMRNQGIFKFEVGFCPGMCIFFTNNIALETSINLLGFTYTRYSQTHNQVETGKFSTTSANFKLNLLSGNLGITFYIPGKASPAK